MPSLRPLRALGASRADGLVPQVMEAGAGAELFVHPEVLVFRKEPRHVALRIVEIAERERPGDARVDAGGRRLRVDARPQALLDARIDSIDAERALGGDREPRVVTALRLVGHGRP